MSQKSDLANNEIDLGELVAALWAHKLLITLFTGLSIFLAAYNALTAEKKFTATSKFQIEQINSSSGFNLSNDLGALASLAGFAGAQAISSTDILFERARGREFIIDMQKTFSIERDPYFNTYKHNPKYREPFWKATIKKIIGWQKTEVEKNAIIESIIVENYRANVLFALTGSGAIEISVTHSDPQKASYYANGFMEEIRHLVEEESETSQALRLTFSATWRTRSKTWRKLKKTQRLCSQIVRWLRRISFRTA